MARRRRFNQAIAPQPERTFANAQKPSNNMHSVAAANVSRGGRQGTVPYKAPGPKQSGDGRPILPTQPPLPSNPAPAPMPTVPQPVPQQPPPQQPYQGYQGGSTVDYFNWLAGQNGGAAGALQQLAPGIQFGSEVPPGMTGVVQMADGTWAYMTPQAWDALGPNQASIGSLLAGGQLLGQVNPDSNAFGTYQGGPIADPGNPYQYLPGWQQGGYQNPGNLPPNPQPAPMPTPPLYPDAPYRPPPPFGDQDPRQPGYQGDRGGAGMDFDRLMDLYNQLPPRTRQEFLREHPAFAYNLQRQVPFSGPPSPAMQPTLTQQPQMQPQTMAAPQHETRPSAIPPPERETRPPGQMPPPPGGGVFPDGEWEPGLPLSPQFEAARRALEDQLAGQLSAIGLQEAEIPITLRLMQARLKADEEEANRQIQESANARGVFASGGTQRDLGRSARGYERTRRDAANDAARALGELARGRLGAHSDYARGLAELILQYSQDAEGDRSNNDKPGPDSEPPKEKNKGPKRRSAPGRRRRTRSSGGR